MSSLCEVKMSEFKNFVSVHKQRFILIATAINLMLLLMLLIAPPPAFQKPPETSVSETQTDDGRFKTIAVDVRKLQCSEPVPSSDSVYKDLSFTQMRECKLVLGDDGFDREYLTYQGKVFHYTEISIPLFSTEEGTKPPPGSDIIPK